ncbi:MAG: ABC transporter permease [Alphaproteobacteria bacterium]
MLEIISEYGGRFLDGAILTVELVAIATVIGFVLAVPLALARLSRNPLLAWPAYAYIFFFRGTPLLVQLFLIYYGLGQFESVREGILWPILKDAWWCGLIGLTLNTSAYVAEILRGGILGVPHGDIEAGRACGMTRGVLFRRIVFPKAIRIAWPAYGNEIILLLKGSALVSEITVWDLMNRTKTVFADTYDLQVYGVAGAMYLAIVFVFTRAWRVAERHLHRYLRDQPVAAGLSSNR